MKVGELYRITEEFAFDCRPSIKANDTCLILKVDQISVEVLINERKYKWYIWDAREALAPI